MTCGEMMTMIDALKLGTKSKTENEKKVSQKDSSHSAFGKSHVMMMTTSLAEGFITLSLRKTMLALLMFLLKTSYRFTAMDLADRLRSLGYCQTMRQIHTGSFVLTVRAYSV